MPDSPAARPIWWTDKDVRDAKAIIRQLHDMGYGGLHAVNLMRWIESFADAPADATEAAEAMIDLWVPSLRDTEVGADRVARAVLAALGHKDTP